MKNIKLFLFLGLIANFVFADDIYYPHVEHFENEVNFEGSIVQGQNAFSTNESTFVFNGDKTTNYSSHGDGTFNINPAGGVDGFYIGTNNLKILINEVSHEDLAPVAFSGDYNDLTNTPIKVSDFENDAGYATEDWVKEQAFLTENDVYAIISNLVVNGGLVIDGVSYKLVVQPFTPPPPPSAETTFTLDGGTEQTYDIVGTLGRQWMINKRWFDEDESEWLVTITSANIGTNVTDIEYYTFAACSSLTNVTIPNSITSIGTSAFNSCFGLTNVTISDSVTNIGNYAFYGCHGLASVAIGDSVTTIGTNAFGSCSNLVSVTMSGKDTTQVSGMNNYPWNLPSGCVITCSDGTITVP